MSDRTVLEVARLDAPSAEPFAVLEVFLDQTLPCGGLRAVVRSLHWTKVEAEFAAGKVGGTA